MARKSRALAQSELTAHDTRIWKAALYLRLSVEDGDDTEQNSIGNQNKICRSYIEQIDDITLVDIYTDHGYTGMNFNRPDFHRMYDDIMSGRVNCVVVKDVSRFGRHYIITSEYLQKTFPNMGIRFIAVNDDYDSLKPDSDTEGLLLPFKMILNDSYVKDISRKIRTSIAAKMNSGEYLPSSSSVPFGYMRNPEKNTFDIDTETAPTVKRIFEMRADGMKFNTIARVLNQDKITSPGKIRYLRGISADKRFENAEWIRGTIRKIVSDPVYIGNRVHGKVKRDRLGEAKTRRDKSEWHIVENAHPAIVSAELFDAVQAVNAAELERQNGFVKHQSASIDYRDVLRDKLYCGDCGAKMTALKRNQRLTSDKSAVIFYQCNEYQYSNKTRCSNHYIRQDIVIDAIMRVFNSQLAVVADIEEAIKANKSAPIKHNSTETELRSLRVKRSNIESKLERLIVDLTDGLLNKEEYDYTRARYSADIERIRKDEQILEEKLSEAHKALKTAEIWLDSINRYSKIDEIDKELVDLLVSRIVVYPNDVIHIELNYSDPYKSFGAFLGIDEEVIAG